MAAGNFNILDKKAFACLTNNIQHGIIIIIFVVDVEKEDNPQTTLKHSSNCKNEKIKGLILFFFFYISDRISLWYTFISPRVKFFLIPENLYDAFWLCKPFTITYFSEVRLVRFVDVNV